MSILSSLTSILEPSKWNNSDHKGGDDYWKNGDKDGYSRHDGNDDYSKHGREDNSKHAKNDDCPDDSRKGDHSKHADKDGYSKHDDHDREKHAKDDDHDREKHRPSTRTTTTIARSTARMANSKHDGGWKDAKNEDCQSHKDDCQAQKDYCAPKPSDDCGKGDTYHNPGEMLAKFDFSHGNFGSHGDFGSHGPDHSGDMHGALASMSSDQALDYAIGQMGPADHFDIGHDDVSSHDTAHA